VSNVLLWKNKCWESRGSNLGDIGIIYATINCLRAEIPDVSITLLSDNPEYTANLYGVKSVKISFGNIVKAVKDADLILLGGGTVFTDVSSMSIIPINTFVPYLGVLMKKQIVAWGIGSAKKSFVGKMLVRFLLPHFHYISVRDEESKQDLLNIYPPAVAKISVTEDAAFALQYEGEKKKENIIAIAPRRIFHYKNTFLPFYLRKKLKLLPKGYEQKMDLFKEILAQLADYVIEKYNAKVVFLPMYSAIGDSGGMSDYVKQKFSSRDDIVCKNIMDKMRNKKSAEMFLSDSPHDLLELLGKSRALVGVPLHSLILAHSVATPFVGLSYQEKISRFMYRSQMESLMIPVESMNSTLNVYEFYEKIDSCIEREEELSLILEHTNSLIKEVVTSPAKKIANVLKLHS